MSGQGQTRAGIYTKIFGSRPGNNPFIPIYPAWWSIPFKIIQISRGNQVTRKPCRQTYHVKNPRYCTSGTDSNSDNLCAKIAAIGSCQISNTFVALCAVCSEAPLFEDCLWSRVRIADLLKALECSLLCSF